MIPFNSSEHTLEALAHEVSALQNKLPDARLTGSLGRSVIYSTLLGNPDYEFTTRGQEPLIVAGSARDIDVLGTKPSLVSDFKPFEVDATGYSTSLLEFVRDGEDWFVVGRSHDFAEPVKPEVMEPITGEGTLGIEAVTLPPQTHLALYGLRGQIREKDIKTRDLLHEAVLARGQADLYPDEFLEPLRQIAAINRSNLRVRVQNIYRRTVPNHIRVKAVPFTKLARGVVQ